MLLHVDQSYRNHQSLPSSKTELSISLSHLFSSLTFPTTVLRFDTSAFEHFSYFVNLIYAFPFFLNFALFLHLIFSLLLFFFLSSAVPTSTFPFIYLLLVHSLLLCPFFSFSVINLIQQHFLAFSPSRSRARSLSLFIYLSFYPSLPPPLS